MRVYLVAMEFRRTAWGVAIVSLCVLFLQLALTRLFSATMYYHFAFMAVSVALFGGATAGVALYVGEGKYDPSDPRWMSGASLLFGLSTVVALTIILATPLQLGGSWNGLRLAANYFAAALPFFFGGAVIVLAVRRWGERMSTLYLFDLVGAGAGCLLLIPALEWLGVVDAILATATLAAAVSLLFPLREGRLRTARVAVVAGLLAITLMNLSTGIVRVRLHKGERTTETQFSKWNSFSHVTVRGSLNEDHLDIVIDADASTRITRGAGRGVDDRGPLIEGVVHEVASGGDVLIVGPGGGDDIMLAREAGARSVTGVEVNPIIARDIMQSEPFHSFSGGIYTRPDVTIHVDDGRSFIRGSEKRWSVIQLNMVDTWAATAAGAFALSENQLYTVEAFRDYLDHLEPDGLLSFTRWYFGHGPDQMLRLVSVLRRACDLEGIEHPERHVAIFKVDSAAPHVKATMIFSASPLTAEAISRLERIAGEMGLVTVYTPQTRPEPLFAEILSSPDPRPIWRAYPTDITPTTDNDPFFFHTVRLSQLGTTLRGFEEWRKTNLGTWILFVLLGLSFFLVVAFVLAPLVWARSRKGHPRPPTRTILYFAAIGAGFIVIEIVLLQNFVLLLGHPVYALTVVLFSILTFSGIGSFLSGRVSLAALPRFLPRLLLVVAGGALLYAFALGPAIAAAVALPLPARIAVSVALLLPLSLLLGMPMPSGIRLLAAGQPGAIAWAWGVNGATSVFGSVAALALALLTGFQQVLIAGAVLYLAAVWCVFQRRAARVEPATTP